MGEDAPRGIVAAQPGAAGGGANDDWSWLVVLGALGFLGAAVALRRRRARRLA
jgi:LPXTG-motif cell wall-anchored protein